MMLLHEAPAATERLAAVLNVEASVLASELKSLEALDLVRKQQGGWAASHSTLEASIAAMEQLGEDPDLEVTAYHPLKPRHA